MANPVFASVYAEIVGGHPEVMRAKEAMDRAAVDFTQESGLMALEAPATTNTARYKAFVKAKAIYDATVSKHVDALAKGGAEAIASRMAESDEPRQREKAHLILLLAILEQLKAGKA